MHIRNLTRDDVEAVLMLEDKVYFARNGEHLKLSATRREAMRTTLDYEEALGAFDGEQLIGFIYASDITVGQSNPRYRIDSLNVDPDFQSRNPGRSVGGALLETMLALTDTNAPHHHTYLHVGADNEAAIRLYGLFNFHRDTDEKAHYVADGVRYIAMYREPFAHIVDLPEYDA